MMDHDSTLWFPEHRDEIANRLGWTHLPSSMRAVANGLAPFADEVRIEAIANIVLLGMGGSSLAPEVYQRSFGNAEGHPELVVLDSTHPGAIRAAESELDLDSALFVVSSKSGSTQETLSLFRYFWSKYEADAGSHFVAVSDPGSSLVALAGERSFRRIFEAPPDVGGRYSALTVFGLVPAALIGVDVTRLLEAARPAESSVSSESGDEALELGAILGEAALAGRDKATFFTSPSLGAFPSWAEQLIAESTGKDGRGIVPVVGEAAGGPEVYGDDRLFIYMSSKDDADPDGEATMDLLEAAGHPVVRMALGELYQLGGAFHRFETAVAAAGAVLGIQPFDQPDVELAKQLAREAMTGGGEQLQAPEPIEAADAGQALEQFLSLTRPGDYVAIQAFLAPNPAVAESLEEMRLAIRDQRRAATTLGFGPRFLHSTGQLHKGGPDTGYFLQLIDETDREVLVPETDFSFGELIAAQATGDAAALTQRNRRLLRITLGDDPTSGITELAAALG